MAQWEAMNHVVHAVALDLGGSISAEHGIGRFKRDEMRLVKSAEELNMMQRIKAALDPERLMNPRRTFAGGRRRQHRMSDVTTEVGPEPANLVKPSRAAFVFIFVTVMLDMVALGIVVPVLPMLIKQFLNGNMADAAHIVGYFASAWALMQFVFQPIHRLAVGPVRPAARGDSVQSRPGF